MRAPHSRRGDPLQGKPGKQRGGHPVRGWKVGRRAESGDRADEPRGECAPPRKQAREGQQGRSGSNRRREGERGEPDKRMVGATDGHRGRESAELADVRGSPPSCPVQFAEVRLVAPCRRAGSWPVPRSGLSESAGPQWFRGPCAYGRRQSVRACSPTIRARRTRGSHRGGCSHHRCAVDCLRPVDEAGSARQARGRPPARLPGHL
jgi:hypothetical protein